MLFAHSLLLLHTFTTEFTHAGHKGSQMEAAHSVSLTVEHWNTEQPPRMLIYSIFLWFNLKSQFVSIWHGFVPIFSAFIYSLKKSLYRGAQLSHASPKWMDPVRRYSSCPRSLLQCLGMFMRPFHPRPLTPPQMNTLLFWWNSRLKVTTTRVSLFVDATPRIIPQPATQMEKVKRRERDRK